MRRPHRQIEVFDISLMAVVTKAMGAFLVLMLILIPYYPTGPGVEQTVEDAQSKLDDAKENVKQASKAAQSGNIEELKRQLAALELKLSEIEAELRILKARFTQVKEENARLEAENKRLEDELAPLRAENDVLKAESERLMSDLIRVEAERNQLRIDLEALRAETARLEAELRRVTAERDQLRAELEALRAENERLKAENERLRQEAERRGTAAEDLRALVEQLKREVAARDSEIARLDREVAARDARIAQLDAALQARDMTIVQQQQQIAALRQQNAALAQENGQLKQETERAQAEIRRLEAIVEELRRRGPTPTLPLLVHLTWKDCQINNLDLVVRSLGQPPDDAGKIGPLGPFVMPWVPFVPSPSLGQRMDAKDESMMPFGIPLVETMVLANAGPGARFAIYAKLVLGRDQYPEWLERSAKLTEEWQQTVIAKKPYVGPSPVFACFPSWFATNARTVIQPSATHRVDIKKPFTLIGELTVLPDGQIDVKLPTGDGAGLTTQVKAIMCANAPNLCPRL